MSEESIEQILTLIQKRIRKYKVDDVETVLNPSDVDYLNYEISRVLKQVQEDRELLKIAREVILKLVSSKELYADYADDVLSRIEKRLEEKDE